MTCIICGRLTDFADENICAECFETITKNNRLVYIISLLAESYQDVVSVQLRKKIEQAIYPNGVPKDDRKFIGQ